MSMDMQQLQAAAKLAGFRDQWWADLIVVAIALACEKYPHEMRAALGQVFDISGFEECAKRMKVVLDDAQARTQQLRELMIAQNEDLAAIEKRLDALHYAAEHAEQRMARLEQRIAQVERRLAPANGQAPRPATASK